MKLQVSPSARSRSTDRLQKVAALAGEIQDCERSAMDKMSQALTAFEFARDGGRNYAAVAELGTKARQVIKAVQQRHDRAN